MVKNKLLAKRTYWMNLNDLSTMELIANQNRVSQSDIVRMAVKEYCKKHKGD
jgi:cytidylate kinase